MTTTELDSRTDEGLRRPPGPAQGRRRQARRLESEEFDALGRSAQAAGEGAKALAEKQREIVETAFRETSAMVRDFKPPGNPQEILAKQSEYAKKAFEITMQNTRDVAELTKKTTKEATGILRERLHESLAELRDSIGRAK